MLAGEKNGNYINNKKAQVDAKMCVCVCILFYRLVILVNCNLSHNCIFGQQRKKKNNEQQLQHVNNIHRCLFFSIRIYCWIRGSFK